MTERKEGGKVIISFAVNRRTNRFDGLIFSSLVFLGKNPGHGQCVLGPQPTFPCKHVCTVCDGVINRAPILGTSVTVFGGRKSYHGGNLSW